MKLTGIAFLKAVDDDVVSRPAGGIAKVAVAMRLVYVS